VNLLNNAGKYTPQSGHVAVRTFREHDMVGVAVKDDGAGIPGDMLESVFDLFVQSSRTLDRAAGGLGVGLSLVRSLVAMHGGTVTAFSQGEGKGSEFVVMMPFSPGNEETSEAADSAHDAKAPGRCQVPVGGTVLVVEDNADSREMLREVLERSGFKCVTTENGAAALSMLDAVQPDIAILDVGLPELDGFEVARRIRATPKHQNLCLIALTGYGQPSDRAIGREAGFDAHLVKPVRVEQLLTLLAEMRGGRPPWNKRDGAGRPADGQVKVEA
jgi:two-component system CheB/CheR fusion protein